MLTKPELPMGERNRFMVGKCVSWAERAAQALQAAGFEILPLCTASPQCGVNHVFLKVRDAATGQCAYYDPSAEQFGVIGAHRKLFSRGDVVAFNAAHGTHWLEKPILYHHGVIDKRWKDRWEEFETIRAKWGSEIYADIPMADQVAARGSKRFMSV